MDGTDGGDPVVPPVYFEEENRCEPMQEGSASDPSVSWSENPMNIEFATECGRDDPLHIVEDVHHCIVCNEKTEKGITEHTAVTLVKQLKKFDDNDLLSMELKERLLRKGESEMIEVLKSKNFKLQKHCYDRFNDSKLNCATSIKKKKNI